VPTKGNGWTAEHTYDSYGQPKEVIVIQDSTSPIPKKRNTRAAAAAAAAASEKWNAANGAANGTAAKKRKAEEDDAAQAKKAKAKPAVRQPAKQVKPNKQQVPAPAQQPVASTSSSTAAQPPWDDAEGHYIVKPDDVIGGRCKCLAV
jgi:dual-specificity kinase